MKFSRYLFLVLVFMCVAVTKLHAQSAVSDEFLIVPGQSIGQISGDISKAALQKAFGARNVTTGLVDAPKGAEGDTVPGLIVFPHSLSELKLSYLNGKLISLTFTGEPARQSRWMLPHGIRLGTTVQQLQKLNRKPFRIFLSRCDVPSGIRDWNGGELEHDLPVKTVSLELSQPPGVDEKYENRKGNPDYPEGIYLNSDDPIFAGGNSKIEMINIQW